MMDIKKYYYDENQFLKILNNEEKERLRIDINDTLKKFNLEIENIFGGTGGYVNGNSDILGLSYAVINWSLHEIDDANMIEPGLILKYEEKLKELKKTFSYYYKDSVAKNIDRKTDEIAKIFVNQMKKLIFKFFLCKNSDAKVIELEELCFYHLLTLNSNIDALIYKKTLLDVELKIKMFGFNLIKDGSNNKIVKQNHNLEKRFEKLGLKLINMNASYNYHYENNFIDLRTFYDQKDYHPNIDDIINYINDNFKKESELYITLPLFLETKSSLLESNNHGYMQFYFEFYYFSIRIIKKIGTLTDNYNLNILIPNTMSYEDYYWWYVSIKVFLEKRINKIKIGMFVDDVDMLYSYEREFETDIVLIDFDELSYNLGEISYENFQLELEEGLRSIHDLLKYNKIPHPIKAVNLKNEQVMEKLIMMGFKEFIYPNNSYQKLNNVLKNYGSRRGKYVGVAEKRRKFKEKKAEI